LAPALAKGSLVKISVDIGYLFCYKEHIARRHTMTNRTHQYRYRNRVKELPEGFFSSMPLFFKVWFLFVFVGVLTVFGLVGYTFYSVISDPNSVAREAGQLLGEAAKGYNETANTINQ
jgi:hypothetical protein